MLKSYLKIAWRNIVNHKIYSLICVSGLALGIACFLLLYLFVQHEFSYDGFHQNANDIYTVKATIERQGELESYIGTQGALAATLKKDYPVVQEAVRVRNGGTNVFIYKDNKIKTDKMYLVDPEFFDILTYDFICGEKEKALLKPKSLVITQNLANKLFGQSCSALNQTVTIRDESYLVTGIIEDVPDNTIFEFEAIASINSYSQAVLEDIGAAGWQGVGCQTLVRLQKGGDYQMLNEQMTNLQEKYFSEFSKQFEANITLELLPLLQVRLSENDGGNTLIYIYILGTVGIFILLIATINYINLATARSITRAREVGIRKVVGSHRWQLISQFLSESFLIVIFSLGLGLFLTELSLPFFNQLADKNLSILNMLNAQGIISFIAFGLILTLLSGFYPALVLSAFDPVTVLKGKFSNTRKGIRFRQALVTFQFTISVIMMIATWGVLQQMDYIFHKDMGFAREQIVIVGLSNTAREKSAIFKERLLENSNVQAASISTLVPAYNSWAKNPWKAVLEDGSTRIVESDMVPIGYDYLKTLDIELKEGRSFSPSIPSDSTKAVIVNEAFLRKTGWQTGLGHEVERSRGTDRLKIIGVVKDFHVFSLHQKIEPLIMYFQARPYNLIARVNEQDMAGTLKYMKNIWEDFEKKEPFEAAFLDQEFAKQYRQEQTQISVFLTFSVIAIFIACLGLFGLATYSVQLRSKEIGIRKVMGARVSQIVRLLSGDFLKLVLIASIISIPIASYLLNQWLQNFAYRITLLEIWYVFLGAGLLASLMSLLTIGMQTIQAARTNPVDILRDE